MASLRKMEMLWAAIDGKARREPCAACGRITVAPGGAIGIAE